MSNAGGMFALVAAALFPSGVPTDNAPLLMESGCDAGCDTGVDNDKGADTQSVIRAEDAIAGGSGLVSNAGRFARDATRQGRGAAFEPAALFAVSAEPVSRVAVRLPVSLVIRFEVPVLPATLSVRDAD